MASRRSRSRAAAGPGSLGWLAGLALVIHGCTERGGEPYVRMEEPAPAALRDLGPALVSFWGSWCPPCVEETGALRALAGDPPEGIEVVIVAVQEDPAAARRAFPGVRVIADPEGALARAARAQELPVAVLVDRGQLVARFDGPREWAGASIRASLERLLPRR